MRRSQAKISDSVCCRWFCAEQSIRNPFGSVPRLQNGSLMERRRSHFGSIASILAAHLGAAAYSCIFSRFSLAVNKISIDTWKLARRGAHAEHGLFNGAPARERASSVHSDRGRLCKRYIIRMRPPSNEPKGTRATCGFVFDTNFYLIGSAADFCSHLPLYLYLILFADE